MDEFTFPRERMVERLRSHYDIRDEKVLEMMRGIPRHLFVSSALQSQAYGDHAVPISQGQTLSQPYIVARMTELLELAPNSRVLEIGAGSGYQTVILAKLAGSVYAVERMQSLASEAQARLQKMGIRNVTLRCGDGTLGWEIYSPYDAVLVAAGSPSMPEPLLKQLKVGGRIVLPIGQGHEGQNLIRATRTEKGIKTEDFGPCAFVPLIGEHGWK